MKKIPSLFKKDHVGTRLAVDEVVPGSEWVLRGEGVATVKLDGTSCLIRDGKLFKRYDARNKTPPPDFEPAQDPDPITGHYPGWLPVSATDNADRWHREAFATFPKLTDGTYELIGRKVNGNPHNLNCHMLVKHGIWCFEDEPPRTFRELKAWFEKNHAEGIVWHRDNGDMVKIKRRDFFSGSGWGEWTENGKKAT